MTTASVPLSRATRLTAALAAFAITAACGGMTPDVTTSDAAVKAPAQSSAPSPDPVARGKYLAAIGGCGDCHTPLKMGPTGPEPDMARYLAGHPAELEVASATPALKGPWMYAGSVTNTAYAGPWGISYAINLTSDNDTGLGSWSEQVFANAMRTGKHLGVGRPIMPPMPWQAYAHMTDDDMKALFAYLKTVPAIRNKVPEAVVAAPPAS